MSKKNDDSSKTQADIVNGSGFLFQLRIENELRTNRQNNLWRFSGREHRWVDRESDGKGSFIDLIFSDNSETWRAVIECKRVNTEFYFLRPSDTDETRWANLYWGHSKPGYKYIADWYKFTFGQPFPKSTFCVSSEKTSAANMETIGSELLRSVEALAEQDAELPAPEMGKYHIYLPIVITTAPLYLCKFDIQNIDLSDGIVKDGSLVFERSPFVAFEKALKTRPFSANTP